jgi:hypothetical protein
VYESGGVGTHSHSGHAHFDHDQANLTQLLRLRSKANRSRTFFSSLQNESGDRQNCHFRCRGASRQLRVIHFDTSSPRPRNISAQMNGRGIVLGMDADELMTFRSKVSLSRIAKSSLKRGRSVRAALGLISQYGGLVDEGWIYITFR